MTMSPQLKAGQQALRGWEDTIEKLNKAGDRATFMRCMLDLQCKVVAADYGAYWERDAKGELHQALAWPEAFAQSTPPTALVDLLKQAADKGFSESRSCVLEAKPEVPAGQGDGPDGSAGMQGAQSAHIFVTVMKSQDQVRGVTTVVAACRDKTVLQQTAPLRELAAGLYQGFETKQTASAALKIEQRIRQSVALLAVCQSAEGFKGSCMNLVNELARQLKCARVSIGWIKGNAIKLVAMSDTEHLKRHSEQVGLLELAMGECLDQQQPVLFPPPPAESGEPLLTQAVVHAHRRASAAHGQRQILSIPLRHSDDWIGVLSLEGPDNPLSPDEIQRLQLVADVIAPHLADRRESDRTIPGFAWQSTKRNLGKLIGPKHVAWKMLGVLIVVVTLYIALASWNHRVSASFLLDAEAKRIVPAPFEGNLAEVYVREGDDVAVGDVLAELNVYELKLQRGEAQSRLKMLNLQKSEAKAKQEEAVAAQAEAGLEQVQARLALLDYQISEAQIKAPIAGKVLSGDWYDRVGGVIEQGEAMFEVGPLNQLVALVRVSENDIDQVYVGMTGQIAARTEPDMKFNVVVERIVPVANPVESKNVFEVHCRIDAPVDWMRPGMEGTAKLDVGPRRLYWIITHDVADLLRLWLWW